MTTLTSDSLRWAIRAELATDNEITAGQTTALIEKYKPAVGDAQLRKVFRQELSLANFPDKAAAGPVLQSIGLAPSDLPSADPSGLVGKLGAALKKVVSKEVYKKREVDLAKFDFGDHARMGVKAQTRLIDNRDSVVAGDKFRKALTEERVASGVPTTWAAVGGGLYPGASLGTGIPLGPSGLELRVGFNSSGSLGYSVLAPYAHEWSAAKDAVRNATIDLPINASKAKALAKGSEVMLRGRGRVAGNVGVGIGKTLAEVGEFMSVSATAGFDIGRSEEIDLSMRIKRLDGNKVFVSLSKVDTSSTSASASAHIGTKFDSQEAIGDLGGGAWAAGGKILTKEIDKRVSKWLSADLRAAHTTSEVEKEVANYVIDLGLPGGKQAYEALLKLDATRADTLAAEDGPFGAVRSAKQDEKVGTAKETLNAKLGPIAILSSVDAASATHGTVETQDGAFQYDRALLSDSYSGIISDHWNGTRSLRREFISVQRPGETEPTSYYHFDYKVDEDGVTSGDDVNRFVALGKLLGAVGAEHEATFTDPKFVKKLDDSDRHIDLYFEQDGLAKIADASPEQVATSFARAYDLIERPAGKAKPGWGEAPWLNSDRPRHAEVMKLLKRGPQPNTGGRRRGSTRDQRYRRITGRNLRADHRAYDQLKQLTGFVDAVKAAPDSEARVAEFAKAKDDLGLNNFWLGLGTIAQLAGPDSVLVNRLSLTDRETDRTYVFASEGAIQDPQAEINRALALGSV